MTEILVIIFILLVTAILVLWLLYRGASGDLKDARENLDGLNAEIAHRDNIIIKLQEAQRVQNVRTEKISSGSAASRFDASVGILQDVASFAATRSGKN